MTFTPKTENFPLIWQPTVAVRWKQCAFGKVLQQLWRCDDGRTEWRNVAVVE